MKTFPAPSIGDVVLLKATFRDDNGELRMKVRPAIVLKVNEPNRLIPSMSVVVCRGTTSDRPVQAWEFAVTRSHHRKEFDRAGIDKDTTFKMLDLITVPWNDTCFVIPGNRRFGETPKIGSLHPSSEARLEEAFHQARSHAKREVEKLSRNPR